MLFVRGEIVHGGTSICVQHDAPSGGPLRTNLANRATYGLAPATTGAQSIESLLEGHRWHDVHESKDSLQRSTSASRIELHVVDDD